MFPLAKFINIAQNNGKITNDETLISFQSTLTSLNNNLQNICKMGIQDLKLLSISSLNSNLQNVSSHQSLHKILESQFYFGEKLDTLISAGSKMIRQDLIFKKDCFILILHPICFQNILLPRYFRLYYFQNYLKYG